MKASDNEFPSVLFDEQGSDPSTPASGFWRLYTKAGGLYLIDDAAAVIGPFGAGGSAFSGARVNHSTTQSRASNSALIFDGEDYDTDSYHTTGGSNSRLTIPTTGKYHVGAFVKSSAGAAGNYGAYFRVNGSATDVAASFIYSNDTTDKQINLSADYLFTAADYVEILVNHSGTITYAAACRFWIHRIN
jgi:hypothetical protein